MQIFSELLLVILCFSLHVRSCYARIILAIVRSKYRPGHVATEAELMAVDTLGGGIWNQPGVGRFRMSRYDGTAFTAIKHLDSTALSTRDLDEHYQRFLCS